jgi:hypothetical protein
MDDRILINPDNRMLGNSGSNDFSLYGAPPNPAVTVGPAGPDEARDAPSLPTPAAAVPGEAPFPSSDLAQSGFAGTPVPSIAPASAAAAPAAAPASAGSLPGPLPEVGGSLAPAPMTLGLEGSALAAPILPPSTPGLDGLSHGLQVQPAAVPPPAPEAVAASLEQPASLEQTPLLAETVTEGPQSALAALTAEIAPVDLSAPVVEGVEDLLGTDPAGGIATLVSLVSVSDVFDVSEVGSDVVTVADPVDLVDTLAADLPEIAPPADEDGPDPADTLLGSVTSPADDLGDPLGGL